MYRCEGGITPVEKGRDYDNIVAENKTAEKVESYSSYVYRTTGKTPSEHYASKCSNSRCVPSRNGEGNNRDFLAGFGASLVGVVDAYEKLLHWGDSYHPKSYPLQSYTEWARSKGVDPESANFESGGFLLAATGEAYAARPNSPEGMGPCNSFPGGTLVLLGDGQTKAIDKVESGDRVLATDPVSGGTISKSVIATITTPGDQDFTDLTVKTADGGAGSSEARAEKLTATWHHPFWDETTARWTDAAELNVGDRLHAPDGTVITVLTVRNYHKRDVTYNLTVNDLHTYYVLAGTTPVLVHNCGVTRGGDESTYSISHDASGSGVIADLDSDGILTMMMHNNPDKGSPLRGKAMFDEVMGHFGDRVQGVQGIWVYGDNLGGFNDAVRGGSSLVAAAKGTWTGRQAARYGFTRARIDEAVPRLDGDFQHVLATFRR